jgi:hypothetical protein
MGVISCGEIVGVPSALFMFEKILGNKLDLGTRILPPLTAGVATSSYVLLARLHVPFGRKRILLSL